MFYVYGLIDSSTNKCFYIGKGCKNRMYCHVQKIKRGATTDNPHLDRKINKMLRENIEIKYIKFHEGLTEDIAYELEDRKTREIGLDNLCNVWYGGKGGRVPSEEVRQKISINRRGILVSKETREKMRLAKLGTKVSEETKKKKSLAAKGKSQTEKQKQANSRRGPKGQPFSVEHRERLSEAKLQNPVRYWLGKHHTEETKDKIRKSLTRSGK